MSNVAMDFNKVARTNMVKNQLMPMAVTELPVLDAFFDVPRHLFVDNDNRKIAYSDARIKLDCERELLAPYVTGLMVQALQLNRRKSRVLDIACATGYSTAILAHLAREVVGVESDAHTAKETQKTLEDMGLNNAHIKVGELLSGDMSNAPFDAILVNGALDKLPNSLASQLKVGGRMCYIKRHSKSLCKVMLVENQGHSIDETFLFDTFAADLQ